MSVTTISSGSKKIVFVDYSDCKDATAMIKRLREGIDSISQMPGQVLTLSDFTNTNGTREFMNETKKAAEEILNEKVAKGAVLGISGMKKVLLSGYNMFAKTKLHMFDTKEEAIQYLAS